MISHVPLFAGCSKSELRQIASLADEIDLPAGTKLTKEGASGKEFVVIVDGGAGGGPRAGARRQPPRPAASSAGNHPPTERTLAQDGHLSLGVREHLTGARPSPKGVLRYCGGAAPSDVGNKANCLVDFRRRADRGDPP